VHAFRFREGRLQPLGEYDAPARLQCLNISAHDLNKDGMAEIYVSAIESDNTPKSFVLTMRDDKLVVEQKDIRLFLNVVRTPPEFMPVLLGQKPHSQRIFDADVHEVVRMGGDYTLGKRLNLPTFANVFNFVYLPQGGGEYKIVMVSKRDHLQVYTPGLDKQLTTDEIYGGSSVGITESTKFGAMDDPIAMPNIYYVPLPMFPTDLNNDNTWELLVARPISVSAQFFERYRFFPQGEIHSVYWDGVGLSLIWKTRRIKGSVAGFGLADVDNDGGRDLFVAVNTHPGAVGFAQRRSLLLVYPLDSAAVENVPVDRTFKDED
jgi:hypothetical protein